MRVFGIVLIILGIFSFVAVQPIVQQIDDHNSSKRDNYLINNYGKDKFDNIMYYSKHEYPRYNVDAYGYYSRIAGAVAVVFGFFCFFLDVALQKRSSPATNQPIDNPSATDSPETKQPKSDT